MILLEQPSPARDGLARAFERRGFQVIATDDVETALTAARGRQIALVVTEAMLPGKSTVPFIAQIRQEQPQAHVTVCTTFASIRLAVQYMRAGASSFLIKPVTADVILTETAVTEPTAAVIEHPTYHRAVWEYVNQCRAQAGSLAEASRRLGLQRRSLRRMLQKLPPIR